MTTVKNVSTTVNLPVAEEHLPEPVSVKGQRVSFRVNGRTISCDFEIRKGGRKAAVPTYRFYYRGEWVGTLDKGLLTDDKWWFRWRPKFYHPASKMKKEPGLMTIPVLGIQYAFDCLTKWAESVEGILLA